MFSNAWQKKQSASNSTKSKKKSKLPVAKLNEPKNLQPKNMFKVRFSRSSLGHLSNAFFISDQLAKQLQSIKSERDEYEDMLRELALNEQEEKARLDEIAEMEKRINDRLELQRHRELQMKLKEERLLAAMEEEEEYRR